MSGFRKEFNKFEFDSSNSSPESRTTNYSNLSQLKDRKFKQENRKQITIYNKINSIRSNLILAVCGASKKQQFFKNQTFNDNIILRHEFDINASTNTGYLDMESIVASDDSPEKNQLIKRERKKKSSKKCCYDLFSINSTKVNLDQFADPKNKDEYANKLLKVANSLKMKKSNSTKINDLDLLSSMIKQSKFSHSPHRSSITKSNDKDNVFITSNYTKKHSSSNTITDKTKKIGNLLTTSNSVSRIIGPNNKCSNSIFGQINVDKSESGELFKLIPCGVTKKRSKLKGMK